MNLIKLTLTSFLLTSLIACGGGSPDKETETPNLDSGDQTTGGTTDGGTAGGGTPGGDDGTGGTNLIEDIRFGFGSGADFTPGVINIEGGYSLIGTTQIITANVVDPNNNNSVVSQEYTYRFTSSCSNQDPAASSFLLNEIKNGTGSASVQYTNINCTGPDEITAILLSADGTTELARATSSVDVSIPKLGSGNGADFIAGKITGDVELINETSTLLSLNAVDIKNINEQVNSSNYTAIWTSTCVDSGFSVSEQSLTTPLITTRYDANSCLESDTVTVSLYTQKDLVNAIDTATVSVSIGEAASIAEVPVLGTGNGASFKSGQINLAAEYVLVGSRLGLTVNTVNTDASNTPTKNNYQYQFASNCSTGSFSFDSDVIASSNGQVTNTYFNHNCAGSNTITVSLFAADDLARATALSTATATFDANVPKLGSGSGSAFISGLISGEVNLIDQTSTLLSINAVDTTNVNAVINSSDYILKWDAVCGTAGFSVPQQSLSTSLAETRYDVNSCTVSDTVTASLFSKKDAVNAIDTVTINLSIGAGTVNGITPDIGVGNGSNFDSGKIGLSADYILAGSSIVITVNGVNTEDNNSLLGSNYLYDFDSSCPSNTANFSSNTIANNNGTIVNTYFNRTCDIDNIITVRLFSEGADVNTATPLATATATVKSALPKLGQNNAENFVVGVVEGNLNLIDEASTILSATVVNPLDVNSLVTSADYYVQWSSNNCPSADFSIKSQNLSSPIKTRYDGDADLCQNDTITLTLFNKFDDELDSITADILVSESLVPAEPALGTGSTTTFIAGELDFSEANIAARQTIEVSVNIADITNANTLITDTEYAVVFSSACVTGGNASFDNTQIRTTSGTATTFYTANGCKEQDTINAALYAVEDNVVNTTTSLAIAKGDITIALPESNSIEYQSMTDRKIAMQNISFSELPETTTVSFIVKDEFNQPISGKQVAFSLSNKSVGASLSGGTSGSIQGEGEVLASTNAAGIVTITVKSGTTHGLVTVLAVAEKNDGTLLRTQSFGISITTGIPVQTSFSLVLDNLNPRGWNFFGETVSATVFLADRFQNPVPDGTIVNFIADGGFVEPTCETSNGSCSVNWTAANPRPGFSKDNSPGAKQQSQSALEHPTNDPSSQLFGTGPGVDVNPAWNGGRSGLVTILAYLDGEVNYADANGNGRFDATEDFSPMAEAYLDANEDGVYTAPDENNPFEQLIEYVENGTQDPAPATYQGSTCTEAARGAGHCASLVHIRREVQLVMASDNVGFKIDSVAGGKTADLSAATCINVFNEEFVTFNFSVSDYNGNTPINGTALTLEAEGFEVDAQPDTIGNSNLTEAVKIPVTIRRDDTFEDKKGLVRLSAAGPDGGIAGSISTVELTDDPRIKIQTNDFVIDISSGPQEQIVTFKFEDACGTVPSASDIIIFEAENFDQASYSAGVATPEAARFQIFGSDLAADGSYQLQLSTPVTGAGDGSLKVRAINFSANGLETNRTLPVTVE